MKTIKELAREMTLHQNDELQQGLRNLAGGIQAQNGPVHLVAMVRLAADYIDDLERVVRAAAQEKP